MKDICIKPNVSSDNSDILDEPDILEEDSVWSIVNDNCNICPCEYADFSTDLIKWDFVRAKLWDKSLHTSYGYSDSVALENFLDIWL